MSQVHAVQDQADNKPEKTTTSVFSHLKSTIQKISTLSLALTLPSTAIADESKTISTNTTSEASTTTTTTETVNIDHTSLSLEKYAEIVQSMDRKTLLAEFERLTTFTSNKTLPLKERKYHGKYKNACTDEIEKRTAEMKKRTEILKQKNDAQEKRIKEMRDFKESLQGLQ